MYNKISTYKEREVVSLPRHHIERDGFHNVSFFWNWQRLEAYPAINTIAEETRLSRRGVIYAV